ncbi:DUF1212-domain-containing protein [Cylindrobasidium torrendii FP15055 ss-10]|uniref:DUF1212-domain-containing protein n=1 Tax=Cylindrobasidium torrendii FP15055 ss-10 TaxID=1314674 RepID=A0A0D7BPI9_9AGAR|nr:DUF1212-domain-containing protein [Cylindrobasidium torrendii FP15055 ss-10]
MQAYITRHLAEVAVRQEFILKLARAMMMLGAPSHRLRRQVIDAGHMLGLNVSAMHFPETMFISFEDTTTATSSVRFLRQASTLDLGRLAEAYELYWRATHNELCVADASKQLSDLMQRKHIYPWWFIMLCGGISASAMCGASFYGSFLDTVVVFPLGAAVIGIQHATAGHELFTNVQEIIIAAAFSFLSACLASTGKICYSAVTSSSVALVLPGMVALHGGLELMSRNLISGSVRLIYAVIYAIFVAFGLFVGAELFELMTEKPVSGLEDYYCSSVHTIEGPWWQRSSGVWWSFLTVPLVSLTLALCKYYPYKQWKELILIVFISCSGYTVSHLVEVTKFSGQGDVSAGVGAFAVGLIANLYGELFDGNAFVVMVVGISYLVPSAFGPNGLLAFVSLQSSGVAYAYVGAFSVGLRMVTVSIGLTVGLGLALLITHPIPSGVKDGGVFSM